MAYHQQLSPSESHQAKHGNYRPRSPSSLRYVSARQGGYSAWRRINSFNLRRMTRNEGANSSRDDLVNISLPMTAAWAKSEH